MRISDWSSDVCSSDLSEDEREQQLDVDAERADHLAVGRAGADQHAEPGALDQYIKEQRDGQPDRDDGEAEAGIGQAGQHFDLALEEVRQVDRSEEHTYELQSLMRTSYAVFCLNKKKNHNILRLK